MVLGVPRSSVSTSDHLPKLETNAITNLELQMFTSINTTNSCYYYNNTDQSPILDRSVSNNDVNPNFKYNQPSLSSPFNPFSPTCFDSNNEDNNIQFFQQHQDLPMSHYPQHHHHHPSTAKDNDVNVDMDAGGSGPSLVDLVPRKKASKKDRHSKIVTAQGPRDRRMRLSLEIARKFFTLQDMLGFDKASKTVDWLLTNAKTAIKELSRGMSDGKHSCSGSDKSVSSISECEVISGIDENTNNEDLRPVNISGVQQSAGAIKERRARQTRKPTFHPNAKEYRTMARARARERTMGKMCHKSQQSQETGNLSFKQLKSSSSLEKGEESGCQSHEFLPSLDRLSEIEPTSQEPGNGIMDEPFTITNKGNQSSIFTYNPEIAISQGVSSSNFSFPNFAGNWGMDSARTTSSYSSVIDMNLSSGNVEENIPTSFRLTAPDSSFQPQYADMQSYKLWEPFNHQGQFQR